MILVLGLGNPGKRYEKSRHNVGFSLIDRVAKELSLTFTYDSKSTMEKAETVIEGQKVMFVKPLTYMNLSGNIFPYFRNENITLVIVCVDNMDLDVGKARFKYQGSSAGHNGLKSIIAHYGNDFYRLYIGVGRPSGETSDYVLSKITGSDKHKIDEVLNKCANALIEFLKTNNVEKMRHDISI